MISRALERDPERRWQTIRDVALELESILEAPLPSTIAPPRSGFSWKMTAIAVLLCFLTSAAIFRRLQDSPDGTIGKISLVPLAFEPGNEVDPIFSPDGKSLVYAHNAGGRYQLLVRAQNPVPVTDGTRNSYPVGWSPDGARIYYVDVNDLAVIGASGAAQIVMKDIVNTTTIVKPVAISPDNRALVFARPRADGKSELWLSSPPGADPNPSPVCHLS